MSERELPIFLDYEASSLSLQDSYPIQVAWSSPAGEVDCWFINPKSVEGWDDWDPVAQWDIHGISRDILRDVGRSPREVAGRMNQVLEGKTVYMTGYDYDRFWNRRLFEAAGLEPKFQLGNYVELLRNLAGPMTLGEWQPYYETLSDEAWKRVAGRRHQADTDVRQMIELYRMMSRM